MKFEKALNESKLSVIAQQFKRGTPLFNKSDDEIRDYVGALQDDSGKAITDLVNAKNMVKKMGLNPDDPKLLKALTLGVQTAAQQQATKASYTSIEAERAQEREKRKGDLRGQIVDRGFVN